MRLLPVLFFLGALSVFGQTPEVPHKIKFAGITLTIRDDARREIQKDVDALTQSPKYFNIKAERARMYFPIIEQVFKEEDLPGDFKYLVIQESALIPDAVSVSNAVGFWQFKDFTAVEMGLRVDRQVDERMNIVSSTRAAARYLKKNNTFFNNWIYALQAYQMGAGAVMRSVKDSEGGASHMEITSKTYWYVKKFLAHKVAFEGSTDGPSLVRLTLYPSKTKRSVNEWTHEFEITEDEFRSYNKWIKGSSIPDDRTYEVVRPVANDKEYYLARGRENMNLSSNTPSASLKAVSTPKTSLKRINGVPVVVAKAGDKPTIIAERTGLDLSYFLKVNDISISDPIVEGKYYFTKKKRSRAREAYHKSQGGETLWEISQQYGVQLKKLLRYNRVAGDKRLEPGETVWLSTMKPRQPAASTASNVSEPVLVLDKSNEFNWSAPAQSGAILEKPLEVPAETVLVTSPVAPPDSTETVPITLQTQTEVKDSVSVEATTVQATDSLSTQTMKVEVPKVLNPEQHVVVQGETLYAIAKRYQVGVMDLVEWNGLDLQAGIKPGQVLLLHRQDDEVVESSVSEADTLASLQADVFHIVRASDTLYSIARKYGVTINDLMEWNEKKEFSISVGDKLRIRPK